MPPASAERPAESARSAGSARSSEERARLLDVLTPVVGGNRARPRGRHRHLRRAAQRGPRRRRRRWWGRPRCSGRRQPGSFRGAGRGRSGRSGVRRAVRARGQFAGCGPAALRAPALAPCGGPPRRGARRGPAGHRTRGRHRPLRRHTRRRRRRCARCRGRSWGPAACRSSSTARARTGTPTTGRRADLLVNVDISALHSIEREKEIPFATLMDALETALLTAYKHTAHSMPHARVAIDRKSGADRRVGPGPRPGR